MASRLRLTVPSYSHSNTSSYPETVSRDRQAWREGEGSVRVVDYPYRPSARVFSWDCSYADCLNILLKSYSIMIFILSIIKIMNGRELHPSLDCISNRTLLPSLSSTHLYVSSPLLFLSSQFIACTSPNNATSIIAATGIQLDIANNCASLGNPSFRFRFSTPNNTVPGDCGNSTQGTNGTSSDPGQVVLSNPPTTTRPSLTLPPTTTTLSPEQASSSFSSASGSNFPPVPSNASGSVNLGGNVGGAPPVILLTSVPVSSPTLMLSPTPSSAGMPRQLDGDHLHGLCGCTCTNDFNDLKLLSQW